MELSASRPASLPIQKSHKIDYGTIAYLGRATAGRLHRDCGLATWLDVELWQPKFHRRSGFSDTSFRARSA